MSAVAKLLIASGVRVSGSDLSSNEQTEILKARADIKIGEASEHIPADCELIIYTSAAPATNKERMAGAERKIPELTNFAFLGEWFLNAKTIMVAGTHGKSTATAMLGLILEKAKLDPTVVVGSKVPAFAEGNLRLGSSDLFVIEGDEYARHFLEFHPHGLILNNLELDHVDVYKDIDSIKETFSELISQVKDNGIIVANAGDKNIADLMEAERGALANRGVRVILFGAEEAGAWKVTSRQEDEFRTVTIEKPGVTYRFNLSVPGNFNAFNASGAVLMAEALGVSYPDAGFALQTFKGIWRRFEFLGEVNGAKIYSDYGHHPTAVSETLKAARESFPERKILMCFQPHHRNRTKSLFLDFVPSFDLANELVLAEIYDVAGRDNKEDEKISSRDLADAVVRHDADRGVKRNIEFAESPLAGATRIIEMAKPGDVVICMGAGDIDAEIRKIMTAGK